MTLPTQEQMLYGQLATAEALVEYIRDNIKDSYLASEPLINSMDCALQSLRISHLNMRLILCKAKEAKSVCY